ncbi:MAG: ethanolamine ammonia-lyase reactivating factor EutA, partial [Bradyrhizobiaceae bacterium]|nr:ethanolamine ammonia-lyase reactivating factor EutA [Bradyrhizobiaceae bacterium]
MMEDFDEGGRIFFSNTGRTLAEEDEICLLSVGIDIGSSTSHLVFSRIVLERLDSRYVVAEREAFYQSDILLTPYASGETIDADALGAFFERQYYDAGVDPDEIDSGALILTGVAVRRRNARRIGELFARQAGKLVAVSAGDSLETLMAAHGSGAVARSIRNQATVVNVDVGGGTSKIAVCFGGKIIAHTALDVGARLICFDDGGRVIRVEDAGQHFGAEFGIKLEPGGILGEEERSILAARLANCLLDAIGGGSPTADGITLLRLAPLRYHGPIDEIVFSGGVSEYIYGWETNAFGDMGASLAQAIRTQIATWDAKLERPTEGIRATVIGASQYTTQVSGSTIFVSPFDILPLRNVPVIAPDFMLDRDEIDPAAVSVVIRDELRRLDLCENPVAVFVPWRRSATYQRLDHFCRGVAEGLAGILAAGHPLVLAGDGDVGGLIGIHCREELKLKNPIVSIDGL